jgi:site-specific recombinase XerD
LKKITPLKTEAARRSVPVPCSVVDEIEAFLQENPAADDGRNFQGPTGDLIAVQGINNAVQRTARRAKLGPVNSHLLRHTAASLWIDNGADPESVRRALGHSDIKTTSGIYGHMFSYGAAKLAESMGRRIEQYQNGKSSRGPISRSEPTRPHPEGAAGGKPPPISLRRAH